MSKQTHDPSSKRGMKPRLRVVKGSLQMQKGEQNKNLQDFRNRTTRVSPRRPSQRFAQGHRKNDGYIERVTTRPMAPIISSKGALMGRMMRYFTNAFILVIIMVLGLMTYRVTGAWFAGKKASFKEVTKFELSLPFSKEKISKQPKMKKKAMHKHSSPKRRKVLQKASTNRPVHALKQRRSDRR